MEETRPPMPPDELTKLFFDTNPIFSTPSPIDQENDPQLAARKAVLGAIFRPIVLYIADRDGILDPSDSPEHLLQAVAADPHLKITTKTRDAIQKFYSVSLPTEGTIPSTRDWLAEADRLSSPSEREGNAVLLAHRAVIAALSPDLRRALARMSM